MFFFSSVTGREPSIPSNDERAPREKQAIRGSGTAWQVGLRRGGFVAIVFLALVHPVPTSARPADLPSAKTSKKAERSSANSDTANGRKLAQKIVEVSQLERLDLAKAAEILGSRLGPRRSRSEYVTEWTIEPRPLIARAAAGVIRNLESYVSIVPHPSVGLAFEDFAPLLLDASYLMIEQRAHPSGDSLGTVITSIKHVFRVNVGELIIEVPSTVPSEGIDQTVKARAQGWDAAEGASAHRHLVGVVYFGSRTEENWEEARTLRQLREGRNVPAK